MEGGRERAEGERGDIERGEGRHRERGDIERGERGEGRQR